MITPMQQRRARLARQAFAWVAALTAANLLFNLVASLAGWPGAYRWFLWRTDDNFGDFFSLLASYPNGAAAWPADRAGLHAILPARPLSLYTVQVPAVTHFHMMPLSTVVDLGLLALMRWTDPVLLFLGVFGALAAGWAGLIRRTAASRREAWWWLATAHVSYPWLMTVARGNLFAGLTALALVAALLLGLARRRPALAAVLLAIACNIRPNAILFAAPLLVLYWPQRWRFAVPLTLAGWGVLGASLWVSHALYPAYTLAAIRAGLADYYAVYVTQDLGLAYGSSLFGALRILVGLRPGLDGLALGVALAVLAAGVAARLRGRIDDPTLLFATTASYCLGSTVLGDYHLLVFLAVPLALAGCEPADPAAARAHRLVLIAACLVLAPKNYLFVGDLGRPASLQALLNPLLLLGVAVLVLARAVLRAADQPRRPALA